MHYTCLIIGNDYVNQFAPYREYDGDSEYVVEVDMTEEAREGYNKKVEKVYRHKETGEILSAYDDFFYPKTKFGEKSTSDLVREVPDNWIEEEKRTKELKSFREYLESGYGEGIEILHGEERNEKHDYGFVEIDEAGEVIRYVNRTNPDGHWDWYVLGGRWCGFFPLKETACAVVGQGAGAAEGHQPKPGTADHLRKGDIDIDRSRREAEEEANKYFDEWEKCFTGKPQPKSWISFYEKTQSKEISYDEARTIHREQLAIKAWKEYTDKNNLWISDPVTLFGFNREAYVTKCRNNVLVTYSIVRDGVWTERSADDSDIEQWSLDFQKMYDDLPDDTILTLVDYHT